MVSWVRAVFLQKKPRDFYVKDAGRSLQTHRFLLKTSAFSYSELLLFCKSYENTIDKVLYFKLLLLTEVQQGYVSYCHSLVIQKWMRRFCSDLKRLLLRRTKFRKLFKPPLSSSTCLPLVVRWLNAFVLNRHISWNRSWTKQSLALEVNVLKVNSLEIEESYVMVSARYSWKMK